MSEADGAYHCECDPHGDNAKCDRPCAKPWGMTMKNERITTDFADGFRAGFDVARTQILAAVDHALADYRSVRKAINAVEVPAPTRKEQE